MFSECINLVIKKLTCGLHSNLLIGRQPDVFVVHSRHLAGHSRTGTLPDCRMDCYLVMKGNNDS
jgi:hypothetical protein